MTDRPLWAVEAMVAAMRAARNGPLPASVPGISIDTRTIAPGEAFFAIKGDNRDGHDFVAAALAAGAGLAVVSADRRASFPQDAPLLIVADVLEGLRDLAQSDGARDNNSQVASVDKVRDLLQDAHVTRLQQVCHGGHGGAYAAAGREREFGGADVEVPVHLQGITIHDFPTELQGDLQRQVALTGTGRTENGNQRKLRRV